MSSVSSSSIAVAVAVAVALAACSSPSKPARPPEQPPEPADKVEAPPDDGLPDGPAADQMRWYLALMNTEGASLTEAEYTERFDPSFIEKVPLAQFNPLLGQIGAGRPFELDKVESAAADKLTVVVKAKDGSKLGIYLAVTDDPRHPISGLLMRPVVDAPKLTSWDDLSAKLDARGKYAQYLAAEIDDNDRCVDIKAHGAARQLAIGSAFKLYVLLALHRRIASKALAWDKKLAIRDDRKSLPSGTMQNLEAGTERTVKQFALKMISISDNTATDHLLYEVGRERVERAMVAAHHSQPKKNKPFLATREMFALKLNLDDAGRADYLEMSTRKKRRFLERKLDKKAPDSAAVKAWMKHPRDIDTIEWFANSRDLCNVMAALRAASEGDAGAELREVLAANPGVPVDKKVWTWVGYKGGSEPGVMNLTWLLRHANGRWYFFSLSVNDPDEVLDEGAIGAIGQGALAFFGSEVARGDR